VSEGFTVDPDQLRGDAGVRCRAVASSLGSSAELLGPLAQSLAQIDVAEVQSAFSRAIQAAAAAIERSESSLHIDANALSAAADAYTTTDQNAVRDSQ